MEALLIGQVFGAIRNLFTLKFYLLGSSLFSQMLRPALMLVCEAVHVWLLSYHLTNFMCTVQWHYIHAHCHASITAIPSPKLFSSHKTGTLYPIKHELSLHALPFFYCGKRIKFTILIIFTCIVQMC